MTRLGIIAVAALLLVGLFAWLLQSPTFRNDPQSPRDAAPSLPVADGNDSTASGLAAQPERQVSATTNSVANVSEISELELRDAASARGRPFPLSQSVTRRCARERDTDQTCRASRDFVRNLQLEERDILWARDREERIERSIDALGAGRFVIRSLECRTNRCAVEVAAPGETYIASLKSDPELQKELIAGSATMGFEKGGDGAEIVVTVMGFTRREAL